MNVVNLIGRLTHDVEVRKTPNDLSVCSFTVAVDRFSNGEKRADFINCVAWRNNADNIARYFKKGNSIGLTGSIQTRTYQDKDTGKNRTAFEILVDRFYFTGSNQNSGQAAPNFSTAALDNDFSAIADDDGDLPF